MKSALAAVAVLTAVAAAAVPSHAAAPKPQIVDPKGDSLDTQAAHDVVSVLFTQTKKSGVPKGFTVAMTLAAPPSEMPGITYVISAETGSCGTFEINYSPVTGLMGRDQTTMPCGAPGTTGDPYTIISGGPVVKGSTVTFSYSRKGLPKELQKGDLMTDLRVRVDYNDPVFGIFGPGIVSAPLVADQASSTASFRF